MTTANQQLHDAFVRHQVGLLRVAGSLRRRSWEILDATEAEVRAAIRNRLRTVAGPGRYAVSRTKAAVADVTRIRKRAWREVRQLWRKELADLAQLEPRYSAAQAKTVSPVVLSPRLPGSEQLRRLARESTLMGRTANQWGRDEEAADIARMRDAIVHGVGQQRSPTAIARAVTGTVSRGGRDGRSATTRNNVQTLVRGLVTAVASQARRAFARQNRHIFEAELFTAVLDHRTTDVCKDEHGNVYLIGEGAIPPLHHQCRSIRALFFKALGQGRRPKLRRNAERDLVREFVSERGLPRASRRSEIKRGHRGEFDDWVRERLRSLTGTTPDYPRWPEWFARQPHAFQDQHLGATRAKLYRRGRLPLEAFADQDGNEIPLSELAKSDAAAFRSAGLTPEDFLARA